MVWRNPTVAPTTSPSYHSVTPVQPGPAWVGRREQARRAPGAHPGDALGMLLPRRQPLGTAGAAPMRGAAPAAAATAAAATAA
eukprot:143352-Chlamydomonas_euryale.AAC.1